ncbi:hypothetical protein CYMTET_5616 [Cymbomonas tetramitiformis]|uniref:Peptidase S9 prolyl oligopeptidase catalytic domain-containing protein n=1 Tax=Cymbomonas tetramitiformis TaxID=36881 RepID=A0AAE0LJ81_9CHLO|nr:hypothetical protein CYMTET_5616 [Cymbomonas tetramitiformis]
MQGLGSRPLIGREYVPRSLALKAVICISLLVASTSAALVVGKEWSFIGPFGLPDSRLSPVNRDPLQPFGGIFNASVESAPSELIPGGLAKRTLLSSDSQGVVHHSLGGALPAWLGWAVGEVTVDGRHEACLQVTCQGAVKEAYVDGREILLGSPQPTLRLAAGTWAVHLLLSGSAAVHFLFTAEAARCVASPQPMLLKMSAGSWETGPGKWTVGPKAYDLPDVIDGRLFSPLVAVRVQNRAAAWAKDVQLVVMPTPHVVGFEEAETDWEQPAVQSLAPGQAAVLYALISLVQEVSAADGCPLEVRLKLRYSGEDGSRFEELATLQLRCRKRKDSFQFLFLDVDGTPQMAAARLPIKACGQDSDVDDGSQGSRGAAAHGCPVLLSLHGMDVTASRAADCYKPKPYWVLAPHGRSTSAFFWQGPGDWSALASLEALSELSLAVFGSPWRASPRRLLVTGHSNGGYGAWSFAQLRPDRVLGMAPLAGMPVLAGGEAGFEGDPFLRAVMDASTLEYLSAAHSRSGSNMAGIPFLARTGADDATIAPWLTRRLYRLLCPTGALGGRSCTRGGQAGVVEVPGKGHWWWDTAKENDGGVMDDSQMRQHWKRALAGGAGRGDGEQTLPHRFEYSLWNPATSEGRGGLQPLSLQEQLTLALVWQVPFRLARLQVTRDQAELGADGGEGHETWRVATSNVRRLRLRPPGAVRALDLDGTRLDAEDLTRLARRGAFACREPSAKQPGREPPWVICRPPAAGCARTDDDTSCPLGENDTESDGEASREGHLKQPGSPPSCCDPIERVGPVDYGPMRRVFAKRFMCVVGTAGSDLEVQRHLLHYATLLANRWFQEGAGSTRVVLDRDLMDEKNEIRIAARTHNLILLGGPADNLLSSVLLLRHPGITWHADGRSSPVFEIGGCRLSLARNALVSLGPWSSGTAKCGDEHGERFVYAVIAGAGADGMRKAWRLFLDGAFVVNHWQHRTPEFVIGGETGSDNVVGAGFWGNRWEWQPDASYSPC